MEDKRIAMPGTKKRTEAQKAVYLAGYSISLVAAFTGVSTPFVTQVLQGLRRSARIEAEVARLTGKRVTDLFPPNHGRGWPKGKPRKGRVAA